MSGSYRTEGMDHGQIRNIIRGGFCVGWVIILYRAMAPDESSWFHFIGSPFALIVAVITCPLVLLPAAFVSRLVIGIMIAGDEIAERGRQKLENIQLRQAMKEESKVLQIANASATQQHQRKEIIDKMGSVHDYLALLKTEMNTDRRATIQLGVNQALRDLIGKYTLEDLQTLIRSDHAVAQSVTHAIDELRAAELDRGVEVSLLQRAVTGA